MGRRRVVATVAAVALTVTAAALGICAGVPSAAWEALHAAGSPPIERVASVADANSDGTDDYLDLVQGARKDAEARPTYDGGYYQSGYPPQGRGACTDLVWRAFAEAGYDLKAMVDADVAKHPKLYPTIETPDPNIDFRRVSTLDAFFSAHARSLTTSLDEPEEWMPGDIVVFEHDRHIGVCSDRRDSRGLPLLLHNSGQARREEDYLGRPFSMRVTGHYRFDASAIPTEVFRYWNG